ncbi:MAG: lipoyltransferase [Prevotella sp.]|nr:lipoyltransferase [Prevotella sp.]
MQYIALPDDKTRRLSFYLAMEEYVARRLNTDDDLFFMWQVKPTVIFGRNQLIEAEVNLEFCRERGIETYRRKSGGGCVYADMSNIMFSYITRDEQVNFTFNRYINMIALMLCKLGIDAKTSGRNDILIRGARNEEQEDWRKVSGNAFYHIPGHSIVHGTMLYDTCMENMVGAITPSDAKLVSKGVKSVRQHIALLKDHIGLSIGEFKSFVRRNLCNREIVLNADDIAAIGEIEREYLSEEFIYGRNPAYTTVRRRRIEGVGELEVRMEVKGNTIRSLNLMGDYFLVGDLDNAILKPLRGTTLNRESLEKVLPDRLDDTILNLRRDDFIGLLIS